MGEHAAVYGRPALVSALGLRTRVRVEPMSTTGSGVLELELPDLNLRERLGWDEVLEYGDRRREVWRGFLEQKQGRSTARGLRDEAGVVKVAAAEAMRSLDLVTGNSPRPSLRLLLTSELPRGSGFGSSASVAVAVAAALLGALGCGSVLAPDDARIEKVAFEAEKRQHVRPSGVDHTAVIRGGFLAVTRGTAGLGTTDLPRPRWLQTAIRVFDTGTPSETTGEVVAAVRSLRDRAPDAFEEELLRMENATRRFIAALDEVEPPWPLLIDAVQSFESCLERFGVVPRRVASVVRRIEAAGGAAKISGAGSLSGDAAGCLLVLWPPAGSGARSQDELDRIVEPYRRLDARLGAEGLALTGTEDV